MICVKAAFGSGSVNHRVAIAIGLVPHLAAAARADDQSGCRPAAIGGTAQVRSVVDGRTLQPADGREVRLGGIEVPDLPGRRWKPTEAGQPVQQALLAHGQARFSANIGDKGCTAAFLRAEQGARAAGLGLWADPYYVMRNAEDPAGILKVRGRFASG